MISLPTPWLSPGPAPEVHTLKGGLRVFTLQRPHLQALELGIVYRDGPRFEERERGGIAHLVEHGLMSGPEGMAPFDFHRALEELGATIEADVGREVGHLRMSLPKGALKDALPLFSRLILKPGFEAMGQEKGHIAQEALFESSPERELEAARARLLWPGDPISRPILGPPGPPPAISIPDIKAHHRRTFVTGNTRLYIAGGFEVMPTLQLLESTLGAMPPGPPRPAPPPPTMPSLGPRVSTSTGDGPLGSLLLSFPFPGFTEPGFMALPALEALLGDGLTSLLPWALVEETGLCYRVDATAQAYAHCSALDLHLSALPENLAPALRLTLATLQGLKAAPPNPGALGFILKRLRSAACIHDDAPAHLTAPLAMVDLFGGQLPPIPSAWGDISPWAAQAFKPASATLVARLPKGSTLAPQLQEVLRDRWS